MVEELVDCFLHRERCVSFAISGERRSESRANAESCTLGGQLVCSLLPSLQSSALAFGLRLRLLSLRSA